MIKIKPKPNTNQDLPKEHDLDALKYKAISD